VITFACCVLSSSSIPSRIGPDMKLASTESCSLRMLVSLLSVRTDALSRLERKASEGHGLNAGVAIRWTYWKRARDLGLDVPPRSLPRRRNRGAFRALGEQVWSAVWAGRFECLASRRIT
jgi:hypothetical protein